MMIEEFIELLIHYYSIITLILLLIKIMQDIGIISVSAMIIESVMTQQNSFKI